MDQREVEYLKIRVIKPQVCERRSQVTDVFWKRQSLECVTRRLFLSVCGRHRAVSYPGSLSAARLLPERLIGLEV